MESILNLLEGQRVKLKFRSRLEVDALLESIPYWLEEVSSLQKILSFSIDRI